MIDNSAAINVNESRPIYDSVDAGSGFTFTITGVPAWTLYRGDPEDVPQQVVGSGNVDAWTTAAARVVSLEVWIDARGGGSTGLPLALTQDQYTLLIAFDAIGKQGAASEPKQRHYERRIRLNVE